MGQLEVKKIQQFNLVSTVLPHIQLELAKKCVQSNRFLFQQVLSAGGGDYTILDQLAGLLMTFWIKGFPLSFRYKTVYYFIERAGFNSKMNKTKIG